MLVERLPRKILDYLVMSPGVGADEVVALLGHAMRFGRAGGVLIDALSTRKVVETAAPVLLEACAGYLMQQAHFLAGRSSREPTHARLTLDEFMSGARPTERELANRFGSLLDLVWPQGSAGADDVRAAAAKYELEKQDKEKATATETSPPAAVRLGASVDARLPLLDADLHGDPVRLLADRLSACSKATGFVFPPKLLIGGKGWTGGGGTVAEMRGAAITAEAEARLLAAAVDVPGLGSLDVRAMMGMGE